MDAYTEDKLLFDKYQPRRLDDLDYNTSVTKVLKCLSTKEDFSHLIFYGTEGAGKKTRIRAFLYEIYGSGVNRITTEVKEFKVNTVNVEYQVSYSPYHIGICL
jgi:replication factor C subunit 3/5